MRLKNKVAWIAGIGAGMGKATALLFAQEGAHVIISARTNTILGKTADRIKEHGGQVTILPGDLTSNSNVSEIANKIVSTTGKLDIVYSGAGGFFEPTRNLEQISVEYWDTVLTNTLRSLYNVSHVCHPIMKSQGGGSIVAIGASQSVRQEGNPAYGAAKAGILGLVKNLSKEFYPSNIRINAINAGLFRGKINKDQIKPADSILARTGNPVDIAYAALYLASDESSWVTGQILTVDGGVNIGTRELWEFEA